MPYQTTDDLPEKIKHVLPQHAREIFLAAFNHAWQQYRSPASRRGQASREEVAHKVAWAAVKKLYVKRGETWSPRK